MDQLRQVLEAQANYRAPEQRLGHLNIDGYRDRMKRSPLQLFGGGNMDAQNITGVFGSGGDNVSVSGYRNPHGKGLASLGANLGIGPGRFRGNVSPSSNRVDARYTMPVGGGELEGRYSNGEQRQIFGSGQGVRNPMSMPQSYFGAQYRRSI